MNGYIKRENNKVTRRSFEKRSWKVLASKFCRQATGNITKSVNRNEMADWLQKSIWQDRSFRNHLSDIFHLNDYEITDSVRFSLSHYTKHELNVKSIWRNLYESAGKPLTFFTHWIFIKYAFSLKKTVLQIYDSLLKISQHPITAYLFLLPDGSRPVIHDGNVLDKHLSVLRRQSESEHWHITVNGRYCFFNFWQSPLSSNLFEEL